MMERPRAFWSLLSSLLMAGVVNPAAASGNAVNVAQVHESELDRAEKEFADDWDAPQTSARAQMNPQTAAERVGTLSPPDVSAPAESVTATQQFAVWKQNVLRSMKAKDWDSAQRGLKELRATAMSAGPAQEQQAHAISVDAWMATDALAAARQSAQSWLLACGPSQVASCRKKALSALGKIEAKARGRKGPKKKPKSLEDTERADACLQKAEGSARHRGDVPGCWEEALACYRHQGDRLMVAQALWLKARHLQNQPLSVEQALSRFSEAERACDQQRCLDIRRRSLKAISALALRRGDLETAAQAALKDMGLIAQSLPPPNRSYAWTKEVEQVCARYDAQKGDGACRRLEKRLNAGYCFKDFSATRVSSREGLSQALVARVNEHYGVTLQDCLAEEAARLLPPASVKVQVRWAVSNQGRVEKVQIDRGEGPFGNCVKRSFSVWRYPRYDGELQHVEQQFTVSARPR